MANFRYQHIVSSVNGKVPVANQLNKAEIAVNDYSGNEALYIKNNDGDIVKFIPESAINAILDDDAEVISEALNTLNDNKLDASAISDMATKTSDLDNLKFKRISQNDYDALVFNGTVDENTLYIISQAAN